MNLVTWSGSTPKNDWNTGTCRLLIDNFPGGGIVVFDQDLRFLAAGGSVLNQGGMTSESLEGKTIWEALPPEFVGTLEPMYRRALAGEDVAFDAQWGELVYQTTLTPVLDEAGNVDVAIGYVREVSATRTNEEELARSQQRLAAQARLLQDVIHHSQALVYVKDLEGRYLLANKPFEEFFSLTEGEILGKTDEYLSAEQAPIWRENDRRAVDGPMHFSEWADFGGRQHIYDASKFPLFDEDGQVYATCGISMDITGQIRATDSTIAARNAALKAADALAQQARDLKALFDDAPIGMAVSSIDGVLLSVNRSLCSTLGYTEDELIGATIDSIGEPSDVPTHERYRTQLLTGPKTSYETDTRHIAKNGSTVWTRVSGSLVRDSDGKPLHYITQIQDITAEKLLFAELVRSNQDLSRFAFIASHDLQAPLRMIGGFTEVLLDSLDQDSLSEEQIMMTDFVVKGVGQMYQLIRDLLAAGSVDTSSRPWERIDVAAIHLGVATVLAAEVDSTGAVLKCFARNPVLGNPGQIRQVLQNLINNALAHRSPDRLPVVTTTTRKLPGGMVEVAVTDNGPGIKPEDQERVFEMFQKIGTSPGSGIGLAIVKRIIDQHGGTVSVISDGKTGTSIRFTLPAATRNNKPREKTT